MESPSEIYVHSLENGMTLVAERMPSVSSAAFTILVPVGAASDPEEFQGAAAVLSEMFHKGAGPWNSRQLSEQAERIGLHRSHSAGIEVSTFSGSLLGENLYAALELYATVLREPKLPVEELDSVRELALQDLQSLEDEPSSKVMVELSRRYYPSPFGRCQLGTYQGLSGLSIEALREYYRSSFGPRGVVIGVAGNFDWHKLVSTVEKGFGSWSGGRGRIGVPQFSPTTRNENVMQDTAQVQIALAYPSVEMGHADYYAARMAVNLLSGGMFGRLFVEVREKRGLVYRVSASHGAAKDRAAVFTYAGTTPERCQETLDVILTELRRLGTSIEENELERARTDILSRLIIQSESTSVRANSIVNDWWNLESVRSIEQVRAGIEQVRVADIARHLEQYPVKPITLVTLGPKQLELHE